MQFLYRTLAFHFLCWLMQQGLILPKCYLCFCRGLLYPCQLIKLSGRQLWKMQQLKTWRNLSSQVSFNFLIKPTYMMHATIGTLLLVSIFLHACFTLWIDLIVTRRSIWLLSNLYLINFESYTCWTFLALDFCFAMQCLVPALLLLLYSGEDSDFAICNNFLSREWQLQRLVSTEYVSLWPITLLHDTLSYILE